jgi:DNA polymerase (family 10)
VLEAARARGRIVEVNAQPDRVDLASDGCRLAKEHGVRVSIASDAHSVLDFEHLWLGVAQARRGWLEPDDVVNTRSLAALRRLLAGARR